MGEPKNYVQRMLESGKKVYSIAGTALDLAEERGLTIEETEEIPEAIERILKKERCRDGQKYKRPRSGRATGPRD